MSKLDLHGIRHHEVPRKVDVFLGEHLQKGTNEVTIITGHSDHMKKIVDEVLVCDPILESIETKLSN